MIDMKTKKCCFIGHRKIEITDSLKLKIKDFIEKLILNENVEIFLVGSRSDFNSLCHSIIQELKAKYIYIKIYAYNCKSEMSFLESERKKWEEIFSKREKQPVDLLCVDERIEFKAKYTSGKASYIERNKAMIDDSDYCLFYYDENYLPPLKKQIKQSFCHYQPNSGTSLAYKYAKLKKKTIYNFFI